MAGLGSGIGGFLEGFVGGAEASRKLRKGAADEELTREKLGLLKNADRRSQESHELNLELSRSQEGRAASGERRSQEAHDLSKKAKEAELSEFAAGAGLREETRRRQLAEEGNKLGAAEDQSATREARRKGMAEAEKEHNEAVGRSIMNGTDASGKPTFTMDGEAFASREDAIKRFEAKNGTILDRFRAKFAPTVEQRMVVAGDTDGAAKWNAWVKDGKVGKAIEDIGRVQTAVAIGDWGRAIKSANDVLANGGYVPQAGIRVSIEPVTEGGKTVGAKVTYADKDGGTTSTKEYRDLGEMGQHFATVASPEMMFKYQRQLFDAANAAKVEQAKENNKTANEILKETNKSENAMDMERLKAAIKSNETKYGAVDPDDVFGMMKKLTESSDSFFKKTDANGKLVDMTLEEAVEKTLSVTAGIRARAGRATPTPAAPAAAPAQRPLMSRPQAVVQPTPTQLGVPTPQQPVARSILPR